MSSFPFYFCEMYFKLQLIIFYSWIISFLVPLLHVLAVHARLLAQWPFWSTWQQLSTIQESPTSPMALKTFENGVPLLYRDPTALLIQFTLLLPLHIDQSKHSINSNMNNHN